MKRSILSLYDGAKKTLKDNFKKEAKKENQEQKEDKANLTPLEHQIKLKWAYKSFELTKLLKGQINCYVDLAKSYVKASIKS